MSSGNTSLFRLARGEGTHGRPREEDKRAAHVGRKDAEGSAGKDTEDEEDVHYGGRTNRT